MRQWQLEVGLIVFDMSDFDEFLNMNFLGKYEAEIDYQKNKVWFSLDRGDKFTFRDGWLLSMMINSVKVRKMLSKGYTANLAHIMSKSNDLILDLHKTP